MAKKVNRADSRTSVAFYCKGCDKVWDDLQKARTQAREHTRATGHETRGELVDEILFTKIEPTETFLFKCLGCDEVWEGDTALIKAREHTQVAGHETHGEITLKSSN